MSNYLQVSDPIGPTGISARYVSADDRYIARSPGLRNWLRPESPKRLEMGVSSMQWIDMLDRTRRMYAWALSPNAVVPPTYSGADANFNNQPTLTNAGDSYLRLRPAVDAHFTASLSACTFLMVARPTHTGQNHLLGYPGTPTGTKAIRFGFTAAGGKNQVPFFADTGSNRLINSSVEFQNTMAIFGLTINKKSGRGVRLYVNGLQLDSAPTDLDGLTYGLWQMYGIANGSSSSNWRGSHGDILAYDLDLAAGPNTGWWNGVHDWIGARYNIEVSHL